MDGSRFDDLARSLASPIPRRRILAGIAATLLGAIGTPVVEAATRRGPGNTCREDGNCVTGSRCRADARGRRTCVCDSGRKECGDSCIPVASCCQDGDCRARDTACSKGVCANGKCSDRPVKNGTRCATGACCDGSCVACCNGVGNCIACQTAATCPGQDNGCTTRTCLNGFCGVTLGKAGVAASIQTTGDCKRDVCTSSGGVTLVNDDADLPPHDGNQCTRTTCASGKSATISVAAGADCDQNGGRRCNGSGLCVACLDPSDCPGEDTECQTRICVNGACGFARTPEGTVLTIQTSGDCKRIECDGLGGTIEVNDDDDLPDDGNACTKNLCTAGVPAHPPADAGTPCGTDLVCDGEGTCDGCASPASCPGEDTACQTRTCTAGTCGFSYATAGTATTIPASGPCQKVVCNGTGGTEEIVDNTLTPEDDGNPCTENVCKDGVAYPLLPAGTECRLFPASVCDATGACVPLKLRGLPCQTAAECTSGFCADGVCCDAECNLTCRACTAALRGTGEDGVCGPIQAGLDPNDECPGTTTCNGIGACTGCVSASECPGEDNDCQQRTCSSGICGFTFTASGTATANQTAGDCKKNVCDGTGSVILIDDDSDVPADDGNACTREICTAGVPSTNYRDAGYECGSGGAVCNGSGVCVGCLIPADCPGEDTECRVRTCTDGQCGFGNTEAGTPTASQTPGDCKQIQCDGNGGTTEVDDDTDVPADDGNQCTQNVCSGGVAYPPQPLGTECTQSLGALCDGKGMCIKQAFNATPCTLDIECLSFMCVDGYCCNSTCQLPCRACNVPDHIGDCIITPGAVCTESGGSICDSSGQCVA